jgi:hypothetical protein
MDRKYSYVADNNARKHPGIKSLGGSKGHLSRSRRPWSDKLVLYIPLPFFVKGLRNTPYKMEVGRSCNV